MKSATIIQRNGISPPTDPEPRVEVTIGDARAALAKAELVFAAIRSEITRKRAEADELQAELDRLIQSLAGVPVPTKKPRAKPATNGTHVEPDLSRLTPIEPTATELLERAPDYRGPIEPVETFANEDFVAMIDRQSARADAKPKRARKPEPVQVTVDGPGPSDDDLRQATIASIIGETEHKLAARILHDLEFEDIGTVDQLVKFIADDGDPLGLFLMNEDLHSFRSILRDFFLRSGFAASNLSEDGLPKAWLAKVDDEPVVEEAAETEADVDKELFHALHSFQGAKDRWQRLRESGANYTDLKREIGEAFGAQGGSHGPGRKGYDYAGLKDPRFWYGSRTGAPTLSGANLVERVRKLIGIPYPTDVKPEPTKRAAKNDGTLRWDALREAMGILFEGEPSGSTLVDDWEMFQRTGATDAEIVALLSRAFSYEPLTGPDWSVDVSKRLGPRFWATAKGSTSAKPATLHGQSLIFNVRKLLEIGPPIGTLESSSGGGVPVVVEVDRRVEKIRKGAR